MKNKTYVFDIEKFCTHDGPGIRTNIFFKGCNLCCQWCANPESQDFKPNFFFNPTKCIGCGKCIGICKNSAIYISKDKIKFDRKKCVECGDCAAVCPTGARKLYGCKYSIEELISEAEKDIEFYKQSNGGITFSGGEPALWANQIKEIAKYFFSMKVSTAMETCGYAPWCNYEKIIPYLNLVLFDIKIWDSKKHEKYCGKSNELILANLEKIIKECPVIIRMPIIPGINDSEEEIRCIGRYLKSLIKIDTVNILPYHNMSMSKYEGLGRIYLLPNIVPPSNDHMKWVKKILEEYVDNVKIGG